MSSAVSKSMSARPLGALVLATTVIVGLLTVAPSLVPDAQAAKKVSAKKLLNQLPVRSEKPKGYNRSGWRHWIDADRDGCDTREEVLIAEAKGRARTGSGCKVYGKWVSKYDKVRTKNPSSFDVDHLVPLAEAHRSQRGKKRWNSGTRKRFANDLYAKSLIAVSASTNRSKSDGDPASWMPRNTYRCAYVRDYVAVKWRWNLAVDRSEKNAIANQMSKCGKKKLKVAKPSRAKIGTTKSSGDSSGGNSSGGNSGGSTGGGIDPRFSYCYQADAAGYGPYFRGRDPEYDWYTDRDKDGVVCE